MSLTEKAKEYLKAGLSVMPIDDKKGPILAWKRYQATPMGIDEVESSFTQGNVKGLGIICGAVSGGLEVIDVDCKYDETGNLWINIKNLIALDEEISGLLREFAIVRTMGSEASRKAGGGYHILYKCEQIDSNQKVAFAYFNGNRKAVIETRGEGGYVAAYPTPGYEFIQGSAEDIPTISKEERRRLFEILETFDTVEPTVETYEPPSVKKEYSQTEGLPPWTDYNLRTTPDEVLELLKEIGWTEVSREKETGKIHVKRPDSGEPSTAKTSGNIYKVQKDGEPIALFSVFTENGEPFTVNVMDGDKPKRNDRGKIIKKAYAPFEVYAIVKHGNDKSQAAKELRRRGYGDQTSRAPEVKTELIKVEVVNTVNRENTVVSKPGETLTIDSIQTALGEEVVITSPGSVADEEILKAIELIQKTGKRIYIKEGDQEEEREYRYQLRGLFNKYATLEEPGGGLSDRNRDSLLSEVSILAANLSPVDKDIFLGEFLGIEAIKELQITREALNLTTEKIKATREKTDQEKRLKDLLSKAQTELKEGNISGALKELDYGVKEAKLIGIRDILPPELSYADIEEQIANSPLSYKTGYSALDSNIGFTPGTLSLIAGRPGHGKTTFMFNLLLSMSNLYKEEKFYLFSYEEPLINITAKLLNRLTNYDLSGYFSTVQLSKPTNYEFIKHYLKTKRTDIRPLEEGRAALRELMDSGRIRVIDKTYTVEQLSKILNYLSQREKIGGVFIDYAQRIRTELKNKDLRTTIVHVSDELRNCAKDTGLALIVGAQFNREAANKAPTLNQLKESGNLEEDANTVLTVYCPERDMEDVDDGQPKLNNREVGLKINCPKNREGAPNILVDLTWDRWTGHIRQNALSPAIPVNKRPKEVTYK